MSQRVRAPDSDAKGQRAGEGNLEFNPFWKEEKGGFNLAVQIARFFKLLKAVSIISFEKIQKLAHFRAVCTR